MNCDKDNPKSSTIDCRDDEVLDSKGKDLHSPASPLPKELMEVELCLFVKPFCLCSLSLVRALRDGGYWKHVLASLSIA